jgi:hypothetical protein
MPKLIDIDAKLKPECGLNFVKLAMRDFPDKETLERLIGEKRSHSQAFKEPEKPKQQAFRFASKQGEKLPK